jgi:hypothetical protein
MYRNAANARPAAQAQQGGYDAGTYYAHHDFDGPAYLSTTVVHALSEVANVDATTTESTLYQHIDPDALDKLFAPTADETGRRSGQVSFTMWGYTVTVYASGQIAVTASTQPVR